jgi:hypothetical protein
MHLIVLPLLALPEPYKQTKEDAIFVVESVIESLQLF